MVDLDIALLWRIVSGEIYFYAIESTDSFIFPEADIPVLPFNDDETVVEPEDRCSLFHSHLRMVFQVLELFLLFIPSYQPTQIINYLQTNSKW